MNTLTLALSSVDLSLVDPQALLGATFFDTPIGKVVNGVTKAIAAIVVLAALFAGIGNILKGKAIDAVKIFVGALVLGAILWNPDVLITGIEGLGNLVQGLFDSVDEIATDPGAGGGG